MNTEMDLKEALLYEKLDQNRVSCCLCSHRCKISDQHFGICNVRENRGGILYTHSYGTVIARNIDPIEKKPLYHFHPDSYSYSIAAIGCNFKCGFCQNWQISQVNEARALGLEPQKSKPEDIVFQAIQSKSKSISYTYTEPTIFFEFAREIAQIATGKGLANIFVTNGFMTKEMILMAKPWLDAANVDLKSFREETYRKTCKGRLGPVLENIETMKNAGIWIEVTTLVVPGLNDSEDELKDIARFLAGIDPSIPWHISRFHPQYKMTDSPATPYSSLNRAYEIAREAGLRYPYIGNAVGKGNHTWCYNCGRLLIERSGFSIVKYDLKEGACPQCGAVVDGIGL
jgi:pyruvate formate lyase activating enzyme